jgi:hypothetical protein
VEEAGCQTLVEAYLEVLLHFSYHKETAQQIVETTGIFASLPRVFAMFQGKLYSTFLPTMLDLLWNLIDVIPKPRRLPQVQVCVQLQVYAAGVHFHLEHDAAVCRHIFPWNLSLCHKRLPKLQVTDYKKRSREIPIPRWSTPCTVNTTQYHQLMLASFTFAPCTR